MLKTGCIYTPPKTSDGLRISIMSRHTYNDGITPDERILRTSYDLWLPQLAPPPKLIGAYYKRGLPWNQFETRYIDHLSSEPLREEIRTFLDAALTLDLTTLCCEETPARCHRRLLAEYCKTLEPRLVLDIK
ncbi:DUF488 domain-containing protein [Candidatus Woesearchaeota archaeon]|nr:MAG: DUF488 domain-containing protein [Candidatus Woesearchaeota archaeon]